MLPFKIVYTDGYDLNLGVHVFPSRKYRLVRDRLLADGLADDSDFIEPQPATDEDILRVHTTEWVEKLRSGRLSQMEIAQMEIPYSPELVQAVWLAAGGSTLAGRLALSDGFGVNLAGGLHHAFPGHGEGFCPVNDVAVAIRTLQAAGDVRRCLVIDLDVHQGNGTAAIFAGDDSVFTLSMHQENNYPLVKPPSDLDIGLPDGIEDEDYLDRLDDALRIAADRFGQPDLILYLAGADPYCEDQLGGLGLTLTGLQRRDDRVFQWAKMKAIPISLMLAGGYAVDVSDTIQLHVNTVLSGRDSLAPVGER